MTAESPRFPVGTFTPDPRPAGKPSMVTAAAGAELRIQLRNGEQLLLALIIPIAALIGLSRITVLNLPSPRIGAATPGILALAVMSTAFTAQAITTAFDRRYGVLKRLAAAGMTKGLLVAGKCVSVCAVVVLQFVVLGAVAFALGWQPHGDPLWVVLLTVLGIAAFTGLALLIGGIFRAEAVLGLANVIWFVLVLIGGVIVPLTEAPGWLATIGRSTPAGALSDGLRAVLMDGRAPAAWTIPVLLVWIVIGWAGTVRWFRWH